MYKGGTAADYVRRRGNILVRRSVLLLVVVMLGLALLESSSDALANDDGCGGGNNPYNRPDGAVVQNFTDWKVYLIQDCQQRHITDPESLASYNFDNPIAQLSQAESDDVGDLQFMRAREGTLFQVSCSDPDVPERCKVYVIDESPPATSEEVRY
jgi:hypothetical protein